MATRPTRTDRPAPPTTRGASSSRFRRGAAAIREAAGDAAPAYRRRAAGQHLLHDPVFAAYFVHGFGAFCPRCWSVSVGWDGAFLPRELWARPRMPDVQARLRSVLAPRPVGRPRGPRPRGARANPDALHGRPRRAPPARPERRLGRAGSHRRLTRRQGVAASERRHAQLETQAWLAGGQQDREAAPYADTCRGPRRRPRGPRGTRRRRESAPLWPPVATSATRPQSRYRRMEKRARTERRAESAKAVPRPAQAAGAPAARPRAREETPGFAGSACCRHRRRDRTVRRRRGGADRAGDRPVPVSMLTLYTAGLAERPQRGDDRFAVFAELARKVG